MAAFVLGGALSAGKRGSGRAGRLLGASTLPIATAGIGIAGYQSWLRLQPPENVSCVPGTPGPLGSAIALKPEPH